MKNFLREFRSGWRNLVAATVGIGVGIGAYFSLSSLFFRALEHDFGWTKAAAALSLIALPISAFMLPIMGWLVDRYGVRWPAMLAVVAQVLSYICLAHMDGSPWQFYAGILALNLLGCGASPITYTRLIVTEFRDSRGMALAIALAGIASAAIVLPPIIGAVIAVAGWRQAYLTLAAIALGGGLFASILMRPPPPEPALAKGPGTRQEGLSVREAVTGRSFWFLGTSILATSIASIGLVSQFQSLFMEKQLTSRDAIWLLSLMNASVVVSRLVIGRLLDRQSPASWAAGVLVLAAFGPMLLIGGQIDLKIAAIAVVLIGFSVGAEFDLMTFFCGRLFGLKRYTVIYGLLLMFYYWGVTIGGIGYGLIHDRTGLYEPAIMLSVLLLFASAGGFMLIGREIKSGGEFH